MIYLATVVLSLAVALLRGGRLRADAGIRHGWLAVTALALQIAAFVSPTRWEDVPVTVVTYAGLAGFAFLNRRLYGLRMMFLGLLLNVLVMGLNGGYMPVQPDAAAQVGISLDDLAAGPAAKHRLMTDEAVLPVLGDVIPLHLGPLSRVLSIGDLFVFAGAFLLVQELVPPARRAIADQGS